MLDKLKKFGTDVKDKTGRSLEYTKGKTSGFKHPETVEQYIQVMKANKEQIPKLYSRVSSIAEHSKGKSFEFPRPKPWPYPSTHHHPSI